MSAVKDYMARYAAGTLQHKPKKRQSASGVKEYTERQGGKTAAHSAAEAPTEATTKQEGNNGDK